MAAYTVKPVKPQFTGDSYDIFLGEKAGDDGAATIAAAITLSIPNNDISGAAIPQSIKTALYNKLDDYKEGVTFTVTSVSPSGSDAYADPLSKYSPKKSVTLNVKAVYGEMEIVNDIHIGINVKKGKLTIQKTVQGTQDANQSYVFEIKQYSDVNKTTLVRTFYETLRVSGASASRDIINLSKGYYEVTEKSNWSWRYAANHTTVSDTLGMSANGSRNTSKTTANAAFINASVSHNWLYDIDWVVNLFNGGDEG